MATFSSGLKRFYNQAKDHVGTCSLCFLSRSGKRDLRNCKECLKSIQALRGQLRKVRSRLWRVEKQLGVQVPPRELDMDDQEEEEGQHS